MEKKMKQQDFLCAENTSRSLSRPWVCPCWKETFPGRAGPSPESGEGDFPGTNCYRLLLWVLPGRGSPSSGQRTALFPPSWKHQPGSGWEALWKGSAARYPRLRGHGWYWSDPQWKECWILSVGLPATEEEERKNNPRRPSLIWSKQTLSSEHTCIFSFLMWTRVIWAIFIMLFIVFLVESPFVGRLEQSGATTRERQRRAKRICILKRKITQNKWPDWQTT